MASVYGLSYDAGDYFTESYETYQEDEAEEFEHWPILVIADLEKTALGAMRLATNGEVDDISASTVVFESDDPDAELAAFVDGLYDDEDGNEDGNAKARAYICYSGANQMALEGTVSSSNVAIVTALYGDKPNIAISSICDFIYDSIDLADSKEGNNPLSRLEVNEPGTESIQELMVGNGEGQSLQEQFYDWYHDRYDVDGGWWDHVVAAKRLPDKKVKTGDSSLYYYDADNSKWELICGGDWQSQEERELDIARLLRHEYQISIGNSDYGEYLDAEYTVWSRESVEVTISGIADGQGDFYVSATNAECGAPEVKAGTATFTVSNPTGDVTLHIAYVTR